MSEDKNVLVDISDLFINFYTYQGIVRAIEGIDLQIMRGETLGIVGETGCGKSVTAKAIMRLIQVPPGKIEDGSIHFLEPPAVRVKRKEFEAQAQKLYEKLPDKDKKKMVAQYTPHTEIQYDKLTEKDRKKLSSKRMSGFKKRMKPLPPSLIDKIVPSQTAPSKLVIAYMLKKASTAPKDDKISQEALRMSYDLLRKDIPFMQKIRGRYISMIFQEPTSALNPVFTAGDQIAEVILQHRVVEMAKRVQKRLDGEISLSEKGQRPRKIPHKTKNCPSCGLSVEKSAPTCPGCGNVTFKTTRIKAKKTYHCSICDNKLNTEETWCGKCGNEFYGRVSWRVRPFFLKTYRKLFQLIEKNPNALYIRVMGKIPFVKQFRKNLYEEAFKESVKMLEIVRIPDPKAIAYRYPYELSGGMQQRVMIAIALSCNPKLLVADEPTTALDVTIQAQILKLMRDLKQAYGSSILLITHNLGVVAEMCDRVGVMYAGSMAEIADARTIFKFPLHPYTVGLMQAVPSVQLELDRLFTIKGSVPNLIYPPSGCRFHPRCDYAKEYCKQVKPELVEIEKNHFVSCHKVSEARGYV